MTNFSPTLNRTAKKIVAWPLFQICFWTGDFISRAPQWGFRGWYPSYNQLMRWSLQLDRWADLKKWSDAS